MVRVGVWLGLGLGLEYGKELEYEIGLGSVLGLEYGIAPRWRVEGP